jgi:hypothetical protein
MGLGLVPQYYMYEPLPQTMSETGVHRDISRSNKPGKVLGTSLLARPPLCGQM